MKHLHILQTTSTNSYVKELLAAGVEFPDISLIDADFQTGGRGMGTNSWESEREKNLLFSIVCHPLAIPAVHQFLLSQTIAVSLQQVLSEYADDITVKWPNDIYWKDRKLSGTLIECMLQGSQIKDCIIGVGLNVNQTQFLSDAPNPVSLAQMIGFSLNRKLLLEKIMKRFAANYQRLMSGEAEEIVRQYKAVLYRREGFHAYAEPGGEIFEAEIADILPTGIMTLRLRDGSTRDYEFKEVRFLIDNE